MSHYGGLGGISGGRPLDTDDVFEVAVNQVLGDLMRSDDSLCREVWSALANVSWKHTNGDTASYSFRAAGDLIAAVLGRGQYMDWYCSGPYATVSGRVGEALGTAGWTAEVIE